MKTKRWISAVLCVLLCLSITPLTAFAADEADTWDGTADISWYDPNNIETSYEITTAEQLAGLAQIVNDRENRATFNGVTFYLQNDLDLAGHEWISIGWGGNSGAWCFSGIFDGQGHSIYNLYSHESGSSYPNRNSGLFGTLYEGEINNLGVMNANITRAADDSCMASVGILADEIYASTITNCWTSGTVTGSEQFEKTIGGLVGSSYAYSQIRGCYSVAEITANFDGVYYAGAFDSVGGIIGQAYTGTDTISDCWFGGAIHVNSAMAAVGGIIGYSENTTINNCMVVTSDIGVDADGNTCWIGYELSKDATNCFWPNDDKYTSTVINVTSGNSAGTALDDFSDENLVNLLNSNAAEEIQWVMGINHPTFSWDEQHISANYEAVNSAIDKANALSKENYKNFSAVETAINAVIWDKNITEQAEVDAMAQAIEDAIAALEYKDADYTAVDAAIAAAEALNPLDYKDFSAVDDAINAVVRGKNITEQTEVDAMAQAIEDARNALEKKEETTSNVFDTSDTTQTNDTEKNTSAQSEKKGSATSPKTGADENFALIWVSVLAACAAVLTTATVYKRKRKYSK